MLISSSLVFKKKPNIHLCSSYYVPDYIKLFKIYIIIIVITPILQMEAQNTEQFS